KDNKESFRSLANDACELVSAIICVYNDMEKDGITASIGLKKRVDDLIVLLKEINHFAAKHVSKGAVYRMVRLTTETAKIQQFRQRLRQALDVFGVSRSSNLQSFTISHPSSFSRASLYMRRSSKSSKNSESENPNRRETGIRHHRPPQRQPIHLATSYREISLAT
ncbi:hypothetical protein B0H15DRAFT_771309, partial [Mycena belliarum]